MSLNVAARYAFRRPVTVRRLFGDAVVEECLSATFRSLDVDEHAKFDLQTPEGTHAFLAAVVQGLDEIEDENGPVEFSPAVLRRVLILPEARLGLVRAYFDGLAELYRSYESNSVVKGVLNTTERQRETKPIHCPGLACLHTQATRWRQYHGDDDNDVALNRWLSKSHKVSALRFVDDKKVIKVLAALKAMTARKQNQI